MADGTLWVEKHAPRTEEDLVIHKKKIQAVKEYLNSAEGASRLMLLSGAAFLYSYSCSIIQLLARCEQKMSMQGHLGAGRRAWCGCWLEAWA